jgi:ankyrin repeat protein
MFGGAKKRAGELHDAAQKGNINGVREALDKGADINAVDPECGETVLHVAADKLNKKLVELLLSKGANPNIISGQNYTPLIIAAAQGDVALPIVELLLAGRSDPSLAPTSGPNAGGDALHVAASKGANAILEHLLAFGVSPKILPKGSTLMHTAAIGGDAATVGIIATIGVPVDDSDYQGGTPLAYAAISGNEHAAAALLAHGACTEKRDVKGTTPLLHAAIGNKVAVVKLLLDSKANPNVMTTDDSFPISPLLVAAINAYDEVVNMLLDAGASADMQLGDYPSVVEMAQQAGHHSTIALIKRHGIKSQIVALKAAVVTRVAGGLQAGKQEPLGPRAAAIRDLTLLEFNDVYFRNIRFRNSIKAYSIQEYLPFNTIGEYLDAGESGKLALLRAPNLGMTSLIAFDAAIRAASSAPAASETATVETSQPQPRLVKRLDLIERIESQYPQVFDGLLDRYRAVPVSDHILCVTLELELTAILDDQRAAEVALRRFRGETLADIGNSLGLSRERVRQIESRFKEWVRPGDKLPEPEPQAPEAEDGIKVSWRAMYEQLVSYHAVHGNAEVPHRWPDDPKLGTWVGAQRQRRKQDQLNQAQIDLLDQIGFTWTLRERGNWEDRLQELAEFKVLHGHFNVPTHYSAAPKLYQFVISTRHQYKTGTLEQGRIMLLDQIGFPLGAEGLAFVNPSGQANATFHVLSDDFTLRGRNLAITGRLETFTRDEATHLAEQQGATVFDKFSQKVDLLVVGADAGSKLPSARRLGIPIIDETQFATLLRASIQPN